MGTLKRGNPQSTEALAGEVERGFDELGNLPSRLERYAAAHDRALINLSQVRERVEKGDPANPYIMHLTKVRARMGGWVCEVWQSAYGHRANKATWLYYYGTRPPFELRWARPEGTHQIGFQDQRGKAANKPTLGKREANATPLDFMDELLRLAIAAHNARGKRNE